MTTCNCCQQTFETDQEYRAHFQSSATTLPVLQLVREFHLVPKAEFDIAHVERNVNQLTYIAFVRKLKTAE